jgi:hypothetical protein
MGVQYEPAELLPNVVKTNWAIIQQTHTKLPEDGTSETPKHVAVN